MFQLFKGNFLTNSFNADVNGWNFFFGAQKIPKSKKDLF